MTPPGRGHDGVPQRVATQAAPMTGGPSLAVERELLLARCELDRLELALAWHDVRRAVQPGHAASAHPWIGRALKLLLPLIGVARARSVSRYASVALIAWRLVGSLRRG